MQDQERELITGLFGRLQPFESQARDAEAEALIRNLAARQPAAPYLLVQTVLVQEQALKAAQDRIAELEAKAGGASAAPAAGTSFLGSAPKIGPWGSAGSSSAASSDAAVAPQAPRASVPSTRSPLQAAVSQQPAGGGFLRTALATAAGVAGGALLFEGIRNLIGGNPGPFGEQQAATPQTPAELLPPDSTAQDQTYDQNLGQDPDQIDDYDTAGYDEPGGWDDSWA